MMEAPKGYQAVESSQIMAVGYFEMGTDKPFLFGVDVLSKAVKAGRFGRLEIMFKGGARWAYSSVPAQKVQDMMKAESIGKYFNAEIKSNAEAFPPTKLS